MAATALWQHSAGELLEGYARRQFSPVEVLDELYARVERLNPRLRAYLALNADDARRAAQAAEARWLAPGEKPVLCGVPVAVKDTIELRGLPTTYGSLATILWLSVLRRNGIEIPARDYLLVSLVIVPVTLLTTTVALWLML